MQSKSILLLVFLFFTNCSKKTYHSFNSETIHHTNNLTYSINTLERDLSFILGKGNTPDYHFKFANNYILQWLRDERVIYSANHIGYNNYNIFDDNSQCVQILNKAILGATKTVDTKKAKAIKFKAIIKYYECVYDFPENLCDFLGRDNSSLLANETLEKFLLNQFNFFKKKYKSIYHDAILDDFHINIKESPKGRIVTLLDDDEKEIIISRKILHGVFILKFKDFLNSYFRLKYRKWEVENGKKDSYEDYNYESIIKSFYTNFANEFRFALFHEIGHVHLKSISHNFTENHELICDCIASSIFIKEAKNINFGLYENILLSNEENCNIWDLKNPKFVIERTDKVLNFNKRPPLYNHVCDDFLIQLTNNK